MDLVLVLELEVDREVGAEDQVGEWIVEVRGE